MSTGIDPEGTPTGWSGATVGAQRLASRAAEICGVRAGAERGTHHWLLAILERHAAMVQSILGELDPVQLRHSMESRLAAGDIGMQLGDDIVLAGAQERKTERDGVRVSEEDVAVVVLKMAGYRVADSHIIKPPPAVSTTPSLGAAEAGNIHPSAPRPNVPTLERYGRDLTGEALEGRFGMVSGRDEEIALIIETLCRETKRNPLLVGPAGVGKTAIVEGLARRVVDGLVPESLKGARIFAVQASTLTAGAHLAGELEKRVNALVTEAEQPGVIVFLDEVHSIVGAGGSPGASDIASLIKPSLARGKIACIAATTDEEFRRFIEPDAALERRFQPIRIRELSSERTIAILCSLAQRAIDVRGIAAEDGVIEWLVDFAGRFMPNRRFPDKAVDVFEQCIAYATTHDLRTFGVTEAAKVVQRMVGMPVLGAQVLEEHLCEALRRHGLFSEVEIDLVLRRFAPAVRGLDFRPERPNLVALLVGDVASDALSLAEVISIALFGAEDRIVRIDFGRFQHPSDLTMLLGSPPGYVGYNDMLLLHQLAATPWCVVLCENVDATNDVALNVLTQALNRGYFMDARGNHAYVSDAVVILTASAGGALPSTRRLGFGATTESDLSSGAGTAGLVGADLKALIDVIWESPDDRSQRRVDWMRAHVLADVSELSDRYRKQGATLVWHESVVNWLAGVTAGSGEVERLVDRFITPELVKVLPDLPITLDRSIVISYLDERVVVEFGSR